MISKLVLSLISISSFLAAALIAGGGRTTSSIINLFVFLFISLVSLTALFVKSKKFQDILDRRPGEKTIIILFAISLLFFLIMSYLMLGEHNNYVVGLDGVSYFHQAKMYLSGQINVPSHEHKDFFSMGCFINDGKFYSKYFPGWPLILSIGTALGVPWALNPVFGLLTVFIIYLIGKEIYDKETGVFAGALLISSYLSYNFTPTYMSHSSTLFFSSLFFYFMVKIFKEQKTRFSLLAGLSLGIVFLIRPLSAVAISLPPMGYLFYSSIFDKKRSLAPFMTVVLTFLPAFFVFFIYNYLQTGDILLTPFQYYNPFDKFGFGLRSGELFIEPGLYTFFDGLRNIAINLIMLNWAFILFIFIFLIPYLFNKMNKWDILLFAIVFIIIFLHMFWHVRSTRFYYASFFALSLLAARGMNLSEISFNKLFPNVPVKNLNYLFLLFVIVVNIFVIITPQSVAQRYETYKQKSDPFNLVKEKNLSNAVVFLRSIPGDDNNIPFYVQNPLSYEGDVLFAIDLGQKNEELIEYYPEKGFYIYEFDEESISGKLTKLK